ncbi:MAG: hypothetical protein NVSMB14_12190 [Isosphaeraceae bacterium]
MTLVPSQIIQMSISADWVRLAEGEPILCRHCDAALELHQPDAYDPDRWLGTCHACGAWHVIGIREDGLDAVVARLPTAEIIAEATKNRPDLPDPAPKKTRKVRDSR